MGSKPSSSMNFLFFFLGFFFSCFNFTTASVLCIAAMINHIFVLNNIVARNRILVFAKLFNYVELGFLFLLILQGFQKTEHLKGEELLYTLLCKISTFITVLCLGSKSFIFYFYSKKIISTANIISRVSVILKWFLVFVRVLFLFIFIIHICTFSPPCLCKIS